MRDVVRQGERSAQRVAREWRRTGRTLQFVGDDLTVALAGPLAIAGAFAARAAINIESSFTGVQKTVSATAEEFELLDRQLKDLAAGDNPIPLDINDINRIAEQLGQLGIQAGSLPGFTRLIAELNATTDLGEEAAFQIAQIANLFGVADADIRGVGSAIVALGNGFDEGNLKLATTEARIVELASRAASAGEQIGLTVSDVLGFAAAVSSLNIEADAGGTALQKFFQALELAAARGGEDFGVFARTAGATVAEFAELLENRPREAVLQFIEGLNRIDSEGGSAILVLDQLGLAGAQQSRTLTGLTNNTELLRRALELSSDAQRENTALTEESALRFATFESQLQIAQNRLTIAAAAIGEILLPAIVSLADFVSELAQSFSELPEPVQTTVVALGGVIVVTAPLLSIFGRLITSVASLVTVFSRAAPALRAFGLGFFGLSTSASGTAAAIGLFAQSATLALGGAVALGTGLAAVTRQFNRLTGAQQQFAAAISSNPDEFRRQFRLFVGQRGALEDLREEFDRFFSQATPEGGELPKGLEAVRSELAKIDAELSNLPDVDSPIDNLFATVDAGNALALAQNIEAGSSAIERLRELLGSLRTAQAATEEQRTEIVSAEQRAAIERTIESLEKQVRALELGEAGLRRYALEQNKAEDADFRRLEALERTKTQLEEQEQASQDAADAESERAASIESILDGLRQQMIETDANIEANERLIDQLQELKASEEQLNLARDRVATIEENERYAAALVESEAIVERTRTAQERYAASIARVNELLETGALTEGTATREITRLSEVFLASSDSVEELRSRIATLGFATEESARLFEIFEDRIGRTGSRVSGLARSLDRSLEGIASEAIDVLTDDLAEAEDGFKRLGDSILRTARRVLSELAAQSLVRAFVGEGSGSGSGGLFGFLRELFGPGGATAVAAGSGPADAIPFIGGLTPVLPGFQTGGQALSDRFRGSVSGLVRGPGGPTTDSILARLSNREFVVRASAVQRVGVRALDRINAGEIPRFQGGGLVGGGSSIVSSPDSLSGQTVLTQEINVDARGADVGAATRLREVTGELAEQAARMILERSQRGGSFSRRLRGR